MLSCATIATNSRFEDEMIDLVYLNRLDTLCRYQARTERMARSRQSLGCATTGEGAAIASNVARRRNFLNAWVATFCRAVAPGKR
jgi:hypothetical protein